MRLALLALAVPVLAVAVGAQDGAVPEGNAEAGERVFNDRGCYQCHGYAAQAGPGGRLAPDPIPFAAFSRYVRNPTGQMPPYAPSILSDRELSDVYAFLESVPEPPPLESIPALDED